MDITALPKNMSMSRSTDLVYVYSQRQPPPGSKLSTPRLIDSAGRGEETILDAWPDDLPENGNGVRWATMRKWKQ
jgi:hypothetical protein